MSPESRVVWVPCPHSAAQRHGPRDSSRGVPRGTWPPRGLNFPILNMRTIFPSLETITFLELEGPLKSSATEPRQDLGFLEMYQKALPPPGSSQSSVCTASPWAGGRGGGLGGC